MNQKRHDAGLVGSYRRESVQSNVNGCYARSVHVSGCHGAIIDDNRRRPDGWLPPSLESRLANVVTWVRRLCRLAPVTAISQELVKFDTQALVNPEIAGVEYQQGTLAGYELREYLLEKWGRRCAYCKATGVPLQVEHIVPKVRDGSNRASNLTLACRNCNQKKRGP
jgi:5-methylcytosine-specific restriction endonuclease McrA